MTVDKKEIISDVIILIIFAILTVNFDPTISTIFMVLFVGDIVMRHFDRNVYYHIQSKSSWLTALAFAGAGFGLLTIISQYLSPLVGSGIEKLSFASTLEWMSQFKFAVFSEMAPALKDNVWLMLIAFGFFIAYVETKWILRLFEWALDILGVNNRQPSYLLKDIRVWSIMLMISGIFVWLHLSALGLTNNAALFNVGVFTSISIILAIITGDKLSAILFHVIANSTSIIFQYKEMFTFNPFIIIIGISIATIYILTSVKVRKIIPYFGGSITTP